MKKLTIELETLTKTLGTWPVDDEVFTKFIQARALENGIEINTNTKESEVEALERFAKSVEDGGEEIPKTITGFPRDKEGRPMLYMYQIKGFFKEACQSLKYFGDEPFSKHSASLAAFKKVINDAIFVFAPDDNPSTEAVPFTMPDGYGTTIVLSKDNITSRSLRAQTAQGDRITIASSEALPAGSKATIVVYVPDKFEKHVYEWFDYGQFKGLLQWRNGGYGRFTWKLVKSEETDKLPLQTEKEKKAVAKK